MTQDAAGLAAGVKKSAWSLWESDDRQPDPDQIVAICRALKVSSDWLLGLSERHGPRGRL